MARTYKLVGIAPQATNSENIVATIEVTDGDEVFKIETFAHDLTPEYLAKWVGIKEANVMESRKEALSVLKALIGNEIVPELPPAVVDNTLQNNYITAIRNLQETTELVRLKVLNEDGKEHRDAIQAAKTALAAFKG